MFAEKLRGLLGRLARGGDPVMAGYERAIEQLPPELRLPSRYELALSRFAPEKLSAPERARVRNQPVSR